jgi:hypothetical protein
MSFLEDLKTFKWLIKEEAKEQHTRKFGSSKDCSKMLTKTQMIFAEMI